MILVDFLDSFYTKIYGNNYLLLKFRIYSFLRFIVRYFTNFIVPLIFSFNKSKYFLSQTSSIDGRYIVSLTTFPNRINKVWLVIESILRQTKKPDKIILWLSKEQFRSVDDLPKSLLNQKERGLEIYLVDDDIKSHKKYFYSLNLFPDDYLITVDDDIIYPSFLIDRLISLNQLYPNSICCHRAHKILFSKDNNGMLSYSKWKELVNFHGPSFQIFFTSGGGTLFPPNSLHSEVLNSDVFKEICFSADDIWLNGMARMSSTKVVKSDYYSSLLPIINYNNFSLFQINSGHNLNDIQIAKVREYFKKYFSIDPFLNQN
ncbi:MAG: hypothetical protein RIQ59_1926 [Bacteroidota bacterium]|jgi:hypothetical protein